MYSYVSSAGDMSSRKKRVTCHLCNQYLRKVDEKQCACGDFRHKKCKSKWKRKECPALKWFQIFVYQLSLQYVYIKFMLQYNMTILLKMTYNKLLTLNYHSSYSSRAVQKIKLYNNTYENLRFVRYLVKWQKIKIYIGTKMTKSSYKFFYSYLKYFIYISTAPKRYFLCQYLLKDVCSMKLSEIQTNAQLYTIYILHIPQKDMNKDRINILKLRLHFQLKLTCVFRV